MLSSVLVTVLCDLEAEVFPSDAHTISAINDRSDGPSHRHV